MSGKWWSYIGMVFLVLLCVLWIVSANPRLDSPQKSTGHRIFTPLNATRVTLQTPRSRRTILQSNFTWSSWQSRPPAFVALVRSCHRVIVSFTLTHNEAGSNKQNEIQILLDVHQITIVATTPLGSFGSADRLISCQEARPFWFQWSGSAIEVGKGLAVGSGSLASVGNPWTSNFNGVNDVNEEKQSSDVIDARQAGAMTVQVVGLVELSDWLIITEDPDSTNSRPQLCNTGKLNDGSSTWFHLPYTASCYGIFKTPKAESWYKARDQCSGFGAHLASINSWQEMTFLVNAISEGQGQASSGLFDTRSDSDDQFYIGIKPSGAKNSGSEFQWDDKEPFSFQPHKLQMQSSVDKEQCVVMQIEPSVNRARWNLVPCSTPSGLICKASTDQQSPDYELLQEFADIQQGAMKGRIFRCHGDGEFVSSDVICDGNPNCNDKSDEHQQLCSSERVEFTKNRIMVKRKTSCPMTHELSTSGRCKIRVVPSTEKKIHGSTAYGTNSTDDFPYCLDGEAMPENRCVLNQRPSCHDSTDLLKCADRPCPHGHHRCATGGFCVPLSDVCNGQNSTIYDCPGNTDEVGCEITGTIQECTGMFRCSDRRRCIPLSALCDGNLDCLNQDDETSCAFCPQGCKCTGSAVTCKNQRLVEIPQMNQLTDYVDFSHNNISHISSLFNIPTLAYLNLSHNAIEKFSEATLEAFEKLRILDLSHNHLKILGKALANLFRLQQLYLDHNSIASISGTLDSLPNLLLLDLSNNLITHLPNELCQMNLSMLDASHNNIDEVDGCHFDDSLVLVTNLENNPLRKVFGVEPRSSSLSALKRIIKMPSSSTCCHLPPELVCQPHPRKEECEQYDILSWKTLAVFAVIIGLISALSNGFIAGCGITLAMKDQKSTICYILLLAMTLSYLHLSLCVMGLGTVDIWNRLDRQLIPRLWSENQWCHIFGFNYLLSVLASHSISMLYVFFVYKSKNFLVDRHGMVKIFISLICILAACLLICFAPFLYPAERLQFYGQTNRCVPLLPPHGLSSITHWLQLAVHIIFFGLQMALMLVTSLMHVVRKYKERMQWRAEDLVILGIVLCNLVRIVVIYCKVPSQNKNDYESLLVVIAATPAFFNPMLVGHWIKERYHESRLDCSFSESTGALQGSVLSEGETVTAISGPFMNTPLPPLPFAVCPNSLYESYDDINNYDVIGNSDQNVYDHLYEPINGMIENSIYAGLDYCQSRK